VGQQQVREPGVLGEQQGLVALGQHLLEDLLQADHLARPATHEGAVVQELGECEVSITGWFE
jgi:hypothetical protein